MGAAGCAVRGGSIASTSSTVVSIADALQSAFLAVRWSSCRRTPSSFLPPPPALAQLTAFSKTRKSPTILGNPG